LITERSSIYNKFGNNLRNNQMGVGWAIGLRPDLTITSATPLIDALRVISHSGLAMPSYFV
jgi:hypothetical protein